MPLQSLSKTRFEDRRLAALELLYDAGIGVVANDLEPARERTCGGVHAQVGHARKADDGRNGVRPYFLAACSPSERKSFCSHRSRERSAATPRAHRSLKWAYSSAQVGSSCVRVTTSSGGLPEGSTRVRSVKVVGPHLQS